VNLPHIRAKSLAVLNPLGKIDEHIMDDADLAGPLIILLCLGTFLLMVRHSTWPYSLAADHYFDASPAALNSDTSTGSQYSALARFIHSSTLCPNPGSTPTALQVFLGTASFLWLESARLVWDSSSSESLL
jgi:hypothetical protein